MKKNTALAALLVLPFGFCLLTSASCGASKKTATEIQPATEKMSANELRKRLDGAAFRANSMSAKLDLNVETDGGGSISATGNAIWIRDSVLWLNVKKFGIEGARALIRRDSFFVLNRLEQTFFAGDLRDLEEKFGLPGHFDLIEALVLGNAWWPPQKLEWKSDLFEQKHRLRGSDERFLATFLVNGGIFKPHSLGFSERKTGSSASVRLEDWRPVAGRKGQGNNFSYLRHVEIASRQTGRILAEAALRDVEFDEAKTYRFEIPSHYKRAD